MKKFKICMFIDKIRRRLVYVCLGSNDVNVNIGKKKDCSLALFCV